MNISDIVSEEIMPGYHGKLIHAQTMSLVYWDVEQGAEVPEHHHINEQLMQVLEGTFELTVGGSTKVYQPGDFVVIPPNVPHRGKALTSCKLMDVFSPVRKYK